MGNQNKKAGRGSGVSSKDDSGHQVGRSHDQVDNLIEESDLSAKKKKELRKNLDKQTKQKEAYKKLSVSDFECLTIIGRGAFGEVMIARLKSDNQVFALKRMVKRDMIKKHQTEHIRAERDVLALADNPWIVKLHYSFQDNTWLYLAMEFLQGGDLMTILIKKDILSHKEVAFYMCELCLAVQSVHELNYIHRDLKPDNILFDARGHLKLSDFGLCKSFDTDTMDSSKFGETDGKMEDISKDKRDHATKGTEWKKDRRKLAHSMVGTPDYMAPEIFTQQGYGKEVDWWSIGVIMYECLIGYAPFYGEKPIETARKIVKFEDHFIFPPEIDLSPAAEDLMNKFVCRAPKRKKFISDFNNIKRHPFFRSLNWDKIRDTDAAIIPELKDDVDAAMFDQFEPMPEQTTSSTDQAGGNFKGYTYKIDDDKKKRDINTNTFVPTGDDDDEGDEEDNDN